MGKRKRSRSKDDDYDNILKKVKKLEQRLRNRERSSSSSPSTEQLSGNIDVDVDVHQSEIHSPLRDMDMEFQETENTQILHEAGLVNNVVDNGDQATNVEPELDPNILSILGDDPMNQTTSGEKLHKDISPRWQHILTNGLPKEAKAELIKLYPVPENCSNMKAPKLNLEIKAALTEINLKKDNFSENKQNQLSSGIAAIGKALNVALNSDPTSQDLIRCLSDAGRLLCDYHYRESQSRRYSIINTLNKQTRDTVRDTKLDAYLFGSELADHLKSSKAIEKSGSELKPVYAPRMQSRVAPAATHPPRGALNSRGASRTAASETRPYAAARRPPAPAPTTRDRRHEPSTSRQSYHRHRGRKR